MTIQLRFLDTEGRQVVAPLGAKPLVIGRSAEADVHLADEKASRQHCEVRTWDGDYVLKDLTSRNGTFVNEVRTDVTVLRVGDQIRIGSTVLHVERVPEKGARTILKEVSQERESGKGYKTILREIVQSTAAKPKA
jgi:pSer/pThr/pTyr-binding forkhead associated (FHA) protein